MLRSYRTASLRSYQANSDIVEGWVWHGARDSRECAFCWSQEWSLHGLIEPFASHPRCRCSPIGRTVGWEAILGEKGRGIPDTRPKIEKGEDLFEQLPDERKRAILGPAKFAVYQNGELKLEDVAGFRRDKKWGLVGYERSLRDILGPKEAKKWMEKALNQGASNVGKAESPRDRIERLIREGKVTQDVVNEAERLWRERLREGVRMPNGEVVKIALDDLYHAIVDPRIWRHPDRIERAIANVFEIRASHSQRRQAYSRWLEGATGQLAALVLEKDNRLWSVHLIDERRLQRYTKKAGEVLWRQSEQQ